MATIENHVSTSYMTIKKLELKDITMQHIDTHIKFQGWIRRVRIGGGGVLTFIDIYDGTDNGLLKCIVHHDTYKPTIDIDVERKYQVLTYEQLSEIDFLSPGCSVIVYGQLVKSPEGATQLFELKVDKLEVIGKVEDPVTYPIHKSKERQIMGLRQIPFSRVRTDYYQALFRIRSSLLFTIHSFFDSKKIYCIDPNILTSSDCEGAGEMFKLTPQMFGDSDVGLTVSSQLPLEALATGFTSVYTCQKSFRAEESDTSKHLAEFLHVEYETYSFESLEELLTFTEEFLKFCIRETLIKSASDFEILDKSKELKTTSKMISSIIEKDFVRIKHRDAVDLIRKLVKDKAKLPDETGKMKAVKVKEWPQYDGDLSSEHEKILVTYFDGFVFVTHWPLKIKSFYMEQSDDGSGECESFDLLAPKVGEMFGGSMREWRHDKLVEEMERRGMAPSSLQWYVDLRKMGSAPHGGWGLGFDRLLMFMTGVTSVRDIVPFPVYFGHCPY
jgi:asparaginyl-tRNA synthetase